MSIYTAMRAGVSGLTANANAMAVIADNIANVNTVAFKRGEAQFSALVDSVGGAGNQSIAGVTTTSRRLDAGQGTLQQTGSTTDLALSGNGFFIVTDNPQRPGSFVTRSGSFSPDADGRLVNSEGFYLLGSPIDPENPNAPISLTIDAFEPVNVSNVNSIAEMTSTVSVVANLDSRISEYVGAYTPGDLTTGLVTPHFERSLEVYDSLGAVRTLSMAFLKQSSALNQWAVEIYGTDDSGARVTLAASELDFSDTGRLVGPPTQLPPAPAPAAFPLVDDFTIQWTDLGALPPNGSGAADQRLTMDFSSTTQFAVSSALTAATSDGAPPGELIGVEIGSSGVVTARFSNRRSQAIFNVPIATFPSPNNLTALPRGVFSESNQSGQMTINTAGAGGAGVIQSNAVEASNVDLGTEFTNLITTQRAYSASTRVITTADEMLEELILIKR